MPRLFRNPVETTLAVFLCLFVLIEVNYPQLSPPAELGMFVLVGLVFCFLIPRDRHHGKVSPWKKALNGGLAVASVLCCGHVILQSEPFFQTIWLGGQSLGNRAGMEDSLDIWLGAIGLIVVLEATRRTIGWTLPLLTVAFLFYAYFGPNLPGFLLPHRGYPLERIISQAFLHSQGVFGIALRVMFVYVFLFVLFGSLLEASGATRFIIQLAQRLFSGSPGGPAKVAVMSSGLMGSLSGSAVANTATTGTFTIPLMQSCGFPRRIAAGIEAAASSGGALVPPVMGAAAYMMLELVDPPVTYLEIIRAALLPAVLYYISLLLIVHLYARRTHAKQVEQEEGTGRFFQFEGGIFLGALACLILFLLAGYTPFRAVSVAIVATVVFSALHPRTRPTIKSLIESMRKSVAGSIPLISSAACVGIIIGVVTLTGLGTKLPALILPVAQDHLPSALFVMMLSSIVLGMGLPSAVCYLLLATFVGPALGQLGVEPLAAHFFIFYFGMLSMVTPPIALAAYTAATIAGSRIMPTAFAAFRFALVGFTLPYMFVYRPQLLLLGEFHWFGQSGVLPAFLVALLGIAALAASISGFFFTRLNPVLRLVFLAAAGLLLFPAHDGLYLEWGVAYSDLLGIGVLTVGALVSWRK